MGVEVSIVIPCKNEERYIGKLLESLKDQNLPSSFEIIIADASSTDDTLSIINQYHDILPNLKVINGGLPSVGRNLGAYAASGKTLLFIDADAYFKNPNIIRQSLAVFNGKNADLLGCLLNIEKNSMVRLIYSMCNMIIRLSKFDKPFVVGTYMMIKKDVFLSHGGFDESLMHCEDYFLSKLIKPKNFIVVSDYVYTDDRRFKKLGYLNMVLYFAKNTIMKNNKDYFKKDIGYWL